MAFLWLFAKIFVTLASITDSPDVFGYQSSMKNVTIMFMKKWIYNKNGQAVALDCGDSVYDQNGNFALWIHGRNLYNQYGNHVGWTEGGVFYDSNNDVIGFTRDHTQHLPSHPGYGGVPGMPGLCGKPGRPGFEGEPGRPGYGGWSGFFFEDYIEE